MTGAFLDGSAVIRVPVSRVLRETSAWPRKRLDPRRVEDFLTLLLEEGVEAFDPIEVVPDGSDGYVLADGNHRFEAICQTDLTEIPATVLAVAPGADPLAVAFERGITTSARASLPLTRAERHDAIKRLKANRPELSTRDIAAIVGVSHQTVGRILTRSNGPDDEGERHPKTQPSDLDVAAQLFLGIEKVYEARGLGVWDALTKDHTGQRLARALADVYGEDALARALQFLAWVDEAIDELGGRS